MLSLPEPYFRTPDGRITLYNGDSVELMPLMEAETFNAILTDPPYGISWKSNWVPKHEQKEVLAGDKDLTWMGDFLLECQRLLVKEGSLYIMTRWDKLGFLSGLVRNITELNVRNCIVWDRIIHGLGDLKSFAPAYDLILYVTEGKPKLKSETRPTNLWSINREDDRMVSHPTSKPVSLFGKMITCSTDPGDIILDPFAGSGASLVAANRLNRQAIGIEIDEEYCNLIASRLRQLNLFTRQEEMEI
jgi:DNA modification methylase